MKSGLSSLLIVLTWFALLFGCAAPGPAPVELSLIETLGRGTYLVDGWLDLPSIDRRRVEQGRSLDAHAALALASGWGAPEDWGTWGLGTASSIMVHTQASGPFDLAIRAKAPTDPAGRVQTVTVTVNDTPIGQFDADTTWRLHRLPVPDGVVRKGDNRIDLGYAFHIDGIAGRDDRPLALGIVRLGLVPRDAVDEGQAGAPTRLADPTRDALFLLRPGRYVVPYAVPAGAEALSFQLRGSGLDEGVRAALDLTVHTLDGERHPLLNAAATVESTDHTLDIQSLRGRQVLLVFTATLPTGSPQTRIEVRHPIVRAQAPPHARTATLTQPASNDPKASAATVGDPPATTAATLTTPRQPDILIIVLDAARADHFGSYGYGRDTTPELDRLAAESLVFRNVVAECPYTVCSSPSFMSGLSFVQHGVIAKGQRMADEVVTLAESLRDVGYRTVGYTANPNNAHITGADQGFDEFYEMWRYFRDRRRTHPGPLTEGVAGRIAQGFEDQPAFLFVHYVPPHEPYDPDPEFDLFGDPDYDGPVTGQLEQTRAIFFGEMPVSDADLDELEALYDGNLRQVDAWLPKLFDAQRAAGRWDNTIVVVTSDHGEAFGEHGAIGHNTTLYREMLDVPLILRLPKGVVAPSVDVDRLVSLAAVPPTLAALVGANVDPRVTAPDLLAVAPNAGAATADGQVVPLRTSNPDNTIFGMQSSAWKAMVRYHDPLVARLYDQINDPSEATDRSQDQPIVFVGLLTLLDLQLAELARQGANTSELSPEDEEMLRSLGYI